MQSLARLDNADRLKLRTALRRVIDKVVVLMVAPKQTKRAVKVQVHFVGGAVRDYLISHIRAHDRSKRPAQTVCTSFKSLPGADVVDLTDPQFAKIMVEYFDLPFLTPEERAEQLRNII